MTTALDASQPTLLDMAKMMNPDGSIAVRIAELLSKRSDLIADMVFQEANSPFGHRVTTRTALPGVAWRRFGEGIAAATSREDQFTEACGMLRGWSKVDAEEAEINGNAAEFRAKKLMAHFAAMKIEAERALFYEDTATSPEKIKGIQARLNATTAADGKRVILAQPYATVNPDGLKQTSAYIVGWGVGKVYGIFPKGGKGGLRTIDMGVLPVDDGTGTGKSYRAYQSELLWDLGLVVEDFRYLVRVANIDMNTITSDASAGAKLIDSIIQGIHKVYDLKDCRPIVYVNRDLETYLHLQAVNKASFRSVSVDEVSGKPVTSIAGVPVHMSDAILSTEAAVQ